MTAGHDGAGLVRTIGRWTLAGLVLNGVIGSGIFAVPGTIGASLGGVAILAWLMAALLVGVVLACFAEVASRFREAGGPYLYAHAAFGRFAGLQMGWMAMLVRITSAATNFNLFTTYLAELWPPAATFRGKALATTVLVGVLAVVNVRGVKGGGSVSSGFAMAKLVPLAVFIGLGGWWIISGRALPLGPGADATPAGWLEVMLLLFFAFGGFEASLMPLSEAKDPRRDAPFALFAGLGVVTVVYVLVQIAVLVALPDPGASDRPLAEAARVFLGDGGAAFMAGAAMLSVIGWGAAAMVVIPRLSYAMAERGDLPAVFARVHPTFHTPYVSILVFAGLSWVLAVQGTLIQNLSLAAVSRLVTYGLVCASLPALRAQERAGRQPAALFRLPAGPAFAAFGLLISSVLVTRMNVREAAVMGLTVVVATIGWLVVRKREPGRPA